METAAEKSADYIKYCKAEKRRKINASLDKVILAYQRWQSEMKPHRGARFVYVESAL